MHISTRFLSVLSAAALFVAARPAMAQNQPDYAAGMRHAHATDKPVASPAASIAPRSAVTGTVVTYATIGGKAVNGYLAKPAGAAKPGPALIVVHEWWGLNDNIKAVADRYAGEGYTVLAVDLMNGQVATTPDAAMKLYQAAMADVTNGEANVASAVSYLRKNGATTVGSVGYCFGGHWSLRTGLAAGKDVNAVVMYYGAPISDAKEIARLQAPVLGLFGGKDTGIPLTAVREMESAIKAAGKPVTISVYENANHAFANPSGGAYDAAAAEDAWKKSLGFFKANLK